ncbi:amidohydrolase family protein [Mycobacterium kansasii 732]|uniref:N-substituted formamide deformylase n=1 Tax=Mycobacterium pseudokansasii TaxID=2341080 RepID=A0A498QQ50_9MYCO|nr:amidohydrolase [Mycobacterium pseudokansasii]EUA06559.1 amidohydrolase family protein [Mycobacterium kansasii 732]KZS69406.1 amidohydrolase [Mycobacterium kansasii]MBY0387363.1 amidohydrolase [Mycobacterium pseudokansasii]VAZ96238.1 N-substituted formamide deformylase [Mycobacterium pseudokansasii]VAZ97542.1 N-substituted formamide deformylase [Mycobacterium pseudokansasii]
MTQIPSKLLVNGRIYSPTHPDATAMVVRGDTVAWLGSDDVAHDQFPDVEVQDLDGAFVAPGFVDSHIHLSATGLTLSGLDLRSATSRAQCLRMVGDYAAANPGRLIWGHGWDESAWPEKAAPSTADLDAVLDGRPAYLARVDVHSALASSALRRLVPQLPAAAGFAAQQPLTGDAHHLARAAARDLLTDAQLAEARTAALQALAASGVVAVHECAGPEIGGLDDWLALRALQHGVEVTGYWGEAVTTPTQARALMEQTGARGLAGDLFIDGALGSRTAWLHHPYADAPGCTGTCHLDPDAVEAHLRACTEAAVTAGFHVIGDAAVSAVVGALERVVDELGVVAVARCGHRLEHVEMVTAEQAAKLGSWGVIASVQPNFDALWGGVDGMYAQRLGPDRGGRLNPLALLASQGVPLALGSDAPVTGFDPWASVRAAVNHRTAGSAVSARAAFAAATRGGWRAGGVRDGQSGTLVPGAPASYAVWDVDVLDVNAPRDAVQRWSTDPRSRVPALPRLGPRDVLPRCRQTVHRGAVIYG